MKKKIFILALAVIVLTAGALGTLAYFTAESTATNVITAGSIKIELLENMIPKEGGEAVVFEDQDGIEPGDAVSKIVQITNTGANDAFVRVAVQTLIELADGEGDPSIVSFDLDTENWIEHEGFYYYKTALPAGETTEPLFTQVLFDNEMGNEYMNSKTKVIVTAQAVQTANNGTSPTEANGWPAYTPETSAPETSAPETSAPETPAPETIPTPAPETAQVREQPR